MRPRGNQNGTPSPRPPFSMPPPPSMNGPQKQQLQNLQQQQQMLMMQQVISGMQNQRMALQQTAIRELQQKTLMKQLQQQKQQNHQSQQQQQNLTTGLNLGQIRLKQQNHQSQQQQQNLTVGLNLGQIRLTNSQAPLNRLPSLMDISPPSSSPISINPFIGISTAQPPPGFSNFPNICMVPPPSTNSYSSSQRMVNPSTLSNSNVNKSNVDIPLLSSSSYSSSSSHMHPTGSSNTGQAYEWGGGGGGSSRFNAQSQNVIPTFQSQRDVHGRDGNDSKGRDGNDSKGSPNRHSRSNWESESSVSYSSSIQHRSYDRKWEDNFSSSSRRRSSRERDERRDDRNSSKSRDVSSRRSNRRSRSFSPTRSRSTQRVGNESSRQSSSSKFSKDRSDSDSRLSSSKISSRNSDRGDRDVRGSSSSRGRHENRSERRFSDSKGADSRRETPKESHRTSWSSRRDEMDRRPSKDRRDKQSSSSSSFDSDLRNKSTPNTKESNRYEEHVPASRNRDPSSSRTQSNNRSESELSGQCIRAKEESPTDKSTPADPDYYENSLADEKRNFESFQGSESVNSELRADVEEADNIVYTIRSCPADLYFVKDSKTEMMEATSRMMELENKFEEDVTNRGDKIRQSQDPVEPPPQRTSDHHHHHHDHHKCSGSHSSSSSSESSSSESEMSDDDEEGEASYNHIVDEWTRRKKNPYNLHPELWFNEPGQVNDGPLCRCSIKSRKSGIRHDVYPGETPIPLCNMESNNADKLFHYRVTMSPYTNFLTKTPTLIEYDNHEYIFEGFSLFSHEKLDNVPSCKLLRFNIEYTIHLIPETAPENFTVRSLNLFNEFLFHEVLELVDLDWGTKDGGCNRFHFMPRFCRTLPDSGCKEVLSMNTVLNFLIKASKPLLEVSKLKDVEQTSEDKWRGLVDTVRGMIVTKPGMRPSSIRIDQLDRSNAGRSSTAESGGQDDRSGSVSRDSKAKSKSPLIIHQGCRPAQLSYAGDPLYRKAWKQYVKYRHLLNSKPKITSSDKQRLKEQEEKLQEICLKKTMKREVTIELESQGFMCTGLRADLCQHALMIPVLMSHLRFHICLDVLEHELGYKFKDRSLLQLALTHTSYRTNYGTNPDHTRNSLTNCGMRQVEYGDRRIHYQNTRKRGICILLDIMSRFGKQEETLSEIPHNERLEFLGDAVIEFLTSVHLFYMFPWLEEGGLSTYRMALVQNQHLAQLAKKLRLQDFMLYVHGPDLCHESDLRHAMANCCEALMGALFIDGGLDVVDAIFSRTLFDDDNVLLKTWNDVPRHVLQQEEPGGDRHWIKSSPILQKLETFEESIGVKFSHIRLLAKAFTHRNIGDNPLTHGHNQRLEFLGDTVLQLVASEYLYRHYPEHHEGHLSLLRSSLVNSRTQGLVYDDLGMSEYVIFNEDALSDGFDMKTKQRADMLESFMGALYVDKGLDYCWAFCNVCFFPRLKDFIMNQDWNDPKSQLQQCCLTLREVGGGEPDIPLYKVIETIGPTNTRKYVVAVYFRGARLATGNGHSIQQAEMSAATNALKKREELFPILQHQRRFLEKIKQGVLGKEEGASKYPLRKSSVSPRKRRRIMPREKSELSKRKVGDKPEEKNLKRSPREKSRMGANRTSTDRIRDRSRRLNMKRKTEDRPGEKYRR